MDREFLLNELERMKEWQTVNANWRNVKALDEAIRLIREELLITRVELPGGPVHALCQISGCQHQGHLDDA